MIFTAEVIHDDDDDNMPCRVEKFKLASLANPPTVSLVAFDSGHKGTALLRAVLSNYLVTWWGFIVQQEGDDSGDIIIIDEDPTPVAIATSRRDTSRPFIILSASLGDARVLAIANDYEHIGGFCRILYKPGGPSRLQSVLKTCLNILEIKHRHGRPTSGSDVVVAHNNNTTAKPLIQPSDELDVIGLPNDRRLSEATDTIDASHCSDGLGMAMQQPIDKFDSDKPSTLDFNDPRKPSTQYSPLDLQISIGSVIPAGSAGCILKSSIGTIKAKDRRYRVLVVEDNTILRNLLCVNIYL